jgi:hypothetical protein
VTHDIPPGPRPPATAARIQNPARPKFHWRSYPRFLGARFWLAFDGTWVFYVWMTC